MESWNIMKNKIIILIIALLISGCGTKKADPLVKFDSEFSPDQIAFKSNDVIDIYKKKDPKYKIVSNLYQFTVNDVIIKIGEYDDNLGVTGPYFESKIEDVDKLIEEVNNMRVELNLKTMDTKKLKAVLNKSSEVDSTQIKGTNMTCEKLSDTYTVSIDGFIK